MGCGLKPLSRGRGREGEAALWPLTMPIRKGDPGCQSTGQVRSPNVASAAHPSPLAKGLPVAGPNAPWKGQPPAWAVALPPPSLVAFVDCFEKQVCVPILPCLSLPNPFITALVQESGLSEVEMNN